MVRSPGSSRPSRHPRPTNTKHRPDPDLVDKIDEQLFGTRARRTGFGALTGLGGTAPQQGLDFADARFDTDIPLDALDSNEGTPDPHRCRQRAAADPTTRRPSCATPNAWRAGSFRRKALFALGAVAARRPGLQWAHHFRDQPAARVPAAAPALAAWCGWSSCSVEPPRRLEDVVVESTASWPRPPGDAFRLNVVLRNRAAICGCAVLDRTFPLTDVNGELLPARRSARDLRARSREIGAGGEVTLQAALSTGALRVTGYTVEIFLSVSAAPRIHSSSFLP